MLARAQGMGESLSEMWHELTSGNPEQLGHVLTKSAINIVEGAVVGGAARINEIEIILSKLIQLLSKSNEEKWAIVLSNLLDKYNKSNNKQEVARMIISVMQGGSGSLSDLVIQKMEKL